MSAVTNTASCSIVVAVLLAFPLSVLASSEPVLVAFSSSQC